MGHPYLFQCISITVIVIVSGFFTQLMPFLIFEIWKNRVRDDVPMKWAIYVTIGAGIAFGIFGGTFLFTFLHLLHGFR